MKQIFLGLFLVATLTGWSAVKPIAPIVLTSPDKQLSATLTFDGGTIAYSVTHQQTPVLLPSPLSLTLSSGEVLGRNVKLLKSERKSLDRIVPSPLYKRDRIHEQCEELTLTFAGNYQLVFRAYNHAITYRFRTLMKGEITVRSEEARFNIPDNPNVYSTYVNSHAESFDQQMFNSFEGLYYYRALNDQNSRKLMTTPFLSELRDGKKLLISEADLNDYPGMFLNNLPGASALQAVFARYPKVKKQGGHNNLQMLVDEREEYLSQTSGTRSFPWRLLFVSVEDADLIDNDLVYLLAEPSRLSDLSWIKPGKVAWDWWNDWNLKGVKFKTGVNNATYKYYIDFAAKNKIEYVILDEGWNVLNAADLLQVVPEINLPELVAYANDKGVGLILWAGYWALHRDMERVVKHYAEMGVKGFKIDFLDRDDQEMVRFTYDCAALCARYKMVIDYHGVFKPTGLQRTYPNVLNYEGVAGLEQMKWQPENATCEQKRQAETLVDLYDMVAHDVTLPFIRMFNGPIDYTQGAMRNATKREYTPIWSSPMSQGTRCRQLAMYVVFESPFNMLCDSPSNYQQAKDCLSFMAEVPTVWDEMRVLEARVSEQVVVARRKGDVWYIGGMTNWNTRRLKLDLSFLGEGEFQLELFADGLNADRNASDYQRSIRSTVSSKPLAVTMQPGGGFVCRISKNK